MDLQIKNKVVLVTGGAIGIGEAISKACAQEGAIPAAVDRDADACEQLYDTFQSHGRRATIICAELSAANSCEVVYQKWLGSFPSSEEKLKKCRRPNTSGQALDHAQRNSAVL